MVTRTKEFIIYAVLGILSAVSIFLIRFAFVQRKVCLENDYLVEAENCLKLGIVCIILLIIFLAAMAWTWRRNRRAETAPEKTIHLWDSKPFENWYAKETAEIEKIFGKGKIIAMVFSVLMAFSMCQVIFLMLNGMADLSTFLLLPFSAGIIFLMNYMSDYHRKYIKPLDTSIRKTLSNASSQEEFAKQMSGADRVIYMPTAGSGKAAVWLAPDYCYLRQPKTGGIIKTRDIGRAELHRTSYTVGVRHIHFRTCYAIAFFHSGAEKKPFWRMYFRTKEELYHAVSIFQKVGLSQSNIQDKT